MKRTSETLSSYLGLRKITGPRIGIELEYENFVPIGLPEYNKWTLEVDHSLRNNGIELVSIPLSQHRIGAALREATKLINKTRCIATPRCGVHIHVNMLDKTLAEVVNFAVIYTLCEPTIFKNYADGREKSHFCMPVFGNTDIANNVYASMDVLRQEDIPAAKPMTSKKTGLSFIAGDIHEKKKILPLFRSSKYSALNFESLKRLGTYELRHFYGTTDMEEVSKYVKLALRLRQAASLYSDPLEIIEKYEVEGLEPLLKETNIKPANINIEDQEEAEDSATIMAGFISPDWNELEWSFE